MPDNSTSFQLAPHLTARLSWSVRTIAFVHQWRQRARGLAPDSHEAYLAEATSLVLGAVEHLDEQVVQTLRDLYQLTQQLPAPGDTLLVGPLELSVEDRQIEVTHADSNKQVAIYYGLEIERYRYEPLPPARQLPTQVATTISAQ